MRIRLRGGVPAGRLWRLAALWLVGALGGCGSSGTSGGGGGTTLTDAQIASYRAAVASINGHLEAAAGADAAAQFAGSAAWVRSQPGVASVLVVGARMTVTFSTGLIHCFWQAPTEVSTAWLPPVPAAARSRAVPGRVNRALLVRSISGDLNMMRQASTYLDSIKQFYETNGATVTVVDQPGADVALAKTFGQYGSVAYHGHGGPMDDGPGLALGEIATDAKLKAYATDITAGRIATGTIVVCSDLKCKWAGGGDNRDVLVITPSFIKKYYAKGSLPGTLFFNMACFGMADNRLAQAFVDAGSLGYAGWTDETTMGAQGGYALISYLSDNGHLAAALESAKAQGMAFDSTLGPASNLKVFPITSGANLFTTKTEPSITITSPTPAQVIDTNLVQLRGRVTAPNAIRWVTVNLNGFNFALAVDADGNFSRDVRPVVGANTIKVTATSRGGTDYQSVNFSVSGTPLPLWLNLAWNTASTNLDLHLLAKNRDADALETFSDCWSGLPVCFGARLDPEVSNGYGPETTTMAAKPPAGYYRIFVHYVGTGPATTAQTWIVSPNNTISASRTLTAGQWWEVGAITWSDTQVEHVTIQDRLRPDITLVP